MVDSDPRCVGERSLAPRRNLQVVFMAASWHSGTTLLGLMLGAHPDVLFAGEVMCARHLGRRDAPEHLRWCRLCGPHCPVWSNVSSSAGTGWYEQLAHVADAAVVADSSKSTSWVRDQRSQLRPQVKATLLVLTRDGRAVVNSHRRKQPEVSVAEHARAWAKKMSAVETLAAQWIGTTTRIRYEDLTTSPTTTMSTLAAALGLTYHPAMGDPRGAGDPHPLDANPGPLLMFRSATFRSHPGLEASRSDLPWYTRRAPSIQPDMRWRVELSRTDLNEFDRIAGAVNARYAYGD